MTPEQLRQLRRLREIREQSARQDLASAARVQAEATAVRDAAIATSRTLEVGLAERNRLAVRKVAEEGVTRVSLARMALQHQIGQEELVASLRKASQAHRMVTQRTSEATEVRRVWAGKARALDKLDRIGEILADTVISREGN